MKQAHVVIYGMVQGVGYRYFVAEKAEPVGLVGFVKNKKDGNVEALFQAPGKAEEEGEMIISQVIEECKEGPPLSNITNVDIKWESVEEDEKYDSFEIQ